MDVEYLITLRSEKEEFRGSKHFAKGNRRKGSGQGRMYFPLFRRTTVEKAMAPHSSTPAWKIPWTEEPGRLQSMESLRVRHNFTFTFMHWEGNGNTLQCSCLENPRDRGAWWAAVYGVAQSWTRLKRLSSSRTMELKELGVWMNMNSLWGLLFQYMSGLGNFIYKDQQ